MRVSRCHRHSVGFSQNRIESDRDTGTQLATDKYIIQSAKDSESQLESQGLSYS